MNIDIREKIRDIASALNVLLLAFCAVMVITNLALGYTVFKLANTKSRTYVPPVVSQAFTVSDGEVDETYMRMMGQYLSYLKLNVTPANVDRNYGLLLDYVSSNAWNKVQPKLVREATFIKENNVSSAFNIEGVEVDQSNLRIRLRGTLNKWVGSRPLEQESMSYVIQFTYQQSVLEVLSMNKESME